MSKVVLIGCLVVLMMSGCMVARENNISSVAKDLAVSEMHRVPNAINLDFMEKPKWNYAPGVELLGMEQLGRATDNEELLNYVYSYLDWFVDENGNIKTYDMEEYNIDKVNNMKILLEVYERTKEERFLIAAGKLRDQMYSHPRTMEGGWWHKKVYEHQMWLDGLYMGAASVARYDASYRDGKVDWEDVVNQFLIVGRHTYDAKTGLYRHGWDEAKIQAWCDKTTGQSQHAWGRANGWYFMAMADALEYIPEETTGRDTLVERFRNLADTLLTLRDEQTGMWSQVLDCTGQEGNYVESSCSAMFIYGMLKGVKDGVLDAHYIEVAEEAYSKYCETFISTDERSETHITQCCAVAGLGGKAQRSGTFGYYIHEKIRNDDPKSVGPFLMASVLINEKSWNVR